MGDMKLEKIIKFYPAFDKRNASPSKSYGVHGVTIIMALKGDKGAVQFLLYTNWMLPHVTEEFLNKPVLDSIDVTCRFLPLPADIGYHSYKPIYEGQTPITNTCELLDGKPCYYDGSSLVAKKYYNILLEKGCDGVWEELENYYKDIFEEINLTGKGESEE